MNWLETRTFRVLSFLVLFFFSWTFAGGFDLAFAVKNDQQSALSDQQQKKKTKRAEEKLQEALENIEQILTDTETDTDTKKDKLKTKKAKIGNLDKEIKKQFKATEKKLKDAGLPQEILKRHKDFVKLYKDNLKELNTNLDEIEQAQDEFEINEKVEKTKKFLKKVKPPKKHTPLDPNKLPHRTPEPVFKEPRLNKEQFLEDSNALSASADPHEAGRVTGDESRDSYKLSVMSDERRETRDESLILVASNGPLSGLLNSSQLSAFSYQPIASTLNSEPGTQNYLQIAQASAPPTSADLAETIEVQFTPEITAKAEELENNPVKIYNWVRNNIEFVPTYGSIQGADYCLQTKLCNAFDTASLLIALLRVSGIHARYVEGTVEIPIEKIKNWVGGFTDDNSALSFIASGGIPVGGIVSGGKIVDVQMEHIWVEAWVDMIPSQGAIHKQGDMWVPLDASFKQYNYTEGIDIKSEVPFDAESFTDQLINNATINEEENYVTNVDSLFIQQTMEDYHTQVEDYITQNYPDKTFGDLLRKKELIKQEFPVLLGTLPYKPIVAGTKYSEFPDSLRHKITFSVSLNNLLYDAQPLNITKSLPELAGKKITLSYSPATQSDEDVITSYLPKPHTDGTPIDPSELPTSLPAYLINLKPELRIDGEVVATGGTVMMGLTENFVMSFSFPGQSSNVVSNMIEAGEYLGIALDLGRISKEQMLAVRTKLVSTKTKLEAQDFTILTKDDIVGDLLYTTALSYFVELDAMNYMQAKTMGVNITRLPSESISSFELDIAISFYDIPMSVSAGGLAMDVDHNVNVVKALDSDNDKKKQLMHISGMNSSALEHSVLEQLFSTPSNPAEAISAVKALQIANVQSIPIYTINQSNINTILPELQVDANVKANIQNAINAGMEVTVSKTDITFNGWTGVGYIIINPNTGAGAYMISGGTSGASIVSILPFVINGFFSLFVTNAEAAEPYGEPLENLTQKDPQCLIDAAAKCGKEAVEDAMWTLYVPLNLIIDTLCLLLTRQPICLAIGVILLVGSIGHMTYKLNECLDKEEEKCPDLELP